MLLTAKILWNVKCVFNSAEYKEVIDSLQCFWKTGFKLMSSGFWRPKKWSWLMVSFISPVTDDFFQLWIKVCWKDLCHILNHWWGCLAEMIVYRLEYFSPQTSNLSLNALNIHSLPTLCLRSHLCDYQMKHLELFNLIAH